jgi:hypothetical protein
MCTNLPCYSARPTCLGHLGLGGTTQTESNPSASHRYLQISFIYGMKQNEISLKPKDFLRKIFHKIPWNFIKLSDTVSSPKVAVTSKATAAACGILE